MPSAPLWQMWRQACPPITARILPICHKPVTASTTRLGFLPARRYQSWRVVDRHHLRSHSTRAVVDDEQELAITKEVEQRKNELARYGSDPYPRYQSSSAKVGLGEILQGIKSGDGAAAEQNDVVEVGGRITSIRLSGKKLAFIDINEDEYHVQVMLNQAVIASDSILTSFTDQCRLLQRGDFIEVTGHPYVAKNGASSVKAVRFPKLMSPCLQRFPVQEPGRTVHHDEKHAMDRHVQMLTDPMIVSTIKLRAELLRTMRTFFHERDFVEVETPILSAAAGGATARPFETTATEFSSRKLSLRIAPELWLKRLIVGGMSRIFEIGPCFRNEGLDKTHNPEFTSAEFYAIELSLDQLMHTTQKLFADIANTLIARSMDSDADQDILHAVMSPEPFATLDFIPALNKALGFDLPNLDSETAGDDLLEICASHSIPIPEAPTIPRLLDRLSTHYLEPLCKAPTWIMHIPECMSPLSKSFIHPTAANSQPVAARAELFINGREVVNCYEEENDPFAQRRKFMAQQHFARDPKTGKLDEEAMKVDEDYIRALEWGLPPTGGWGCGIDRLVMLFAGKERIGDVLTFGNLRAVTRGAERWEKMKK